MKRPEVEKLLPVHSSGQEKPIPEGHTSFYAVDAEWSVEVPYDFHGFVEDERKNPYGVMRLYENRIIGPVKLIHTGAASPTNSTTADGEAPARKLADAYVDSLKRGDEKSAAPLFSSEEIMTKSRAWSFLPDQDAHENYLAIRKSFLDDIRVLRESGGGLDWSSAVVVKVREIGRHQDEIDALEIWLSFGIEIEIGRRVIAGPLVMDHREWRFLGRCKAPLLF